MEATLSTRCPICVRKVGNLALHQPACARKRGTPAPDQRAVTRAAAHVLPDDAVTAAQRLQEGITDLDVTRLLYALETGTSVVQGGASGWTTEVPSLTLPRKGLATLVTVALHHGLVRAVSEPVAPAVRKVWVVPAPVHLGALRPSCRATRPYGPMRYRLTDDRTLADCQNCLTAAY